MGPINNFLPTPGKPGIPLSGESHDRSDRGNLAIVVPSILTCCIRNGREIESCAFAERNNWRRGPRCDNRRDSVRHHDIRNHTWAYYCAPENRHGPPQALTEPVRMPLPPTTPQWKDQSFSTFPYLPRWLPFADPLLGWTGGGPNSNEKKRIEWSWSVRFRLTKVKAVALYRFQCTGARMHADMMHGILELNGGLFHRVGDCVSTGRVRSEGGARGIFKRPRS